MSSLRPFRLTPWLVRALVPERRIGTYALHRDGAVVYIGRSDTDLQRRLIQHATAHRAEYFTYDVHHSVQHAFEVESSMFHNLQGSLTNCIHPASPAATGAQCPFCRHQVQLALTQRLSTLTPMP
ncbi:hypothetical protein ACH9EU_16830 [Kocuria sp. M1R5S2]|uniref:hypothetical protein n=1 Tax=Kocuria rhizosphaerae TaxID=3376285 RepID=UPI0037BA2619